VIVDQQGRLFFTDTVNDRVMRADAPGATPQPLAAGIEAPGGLSFLPDGDLLVGTGDAILTGLFGNILPSSGLVRVDPDTGAKQAYAPGLQMANGVEVGPGGETYASNDVGFGIDRVGPGGAPVQIRWAVVFSPNGLVIDSAGEWLYAAQTFQPAAISRIRIANPVQVETFAAGSLPDITAGLDGLTRDENDQLYVAANATGEVWKVSNPGREICALATGLGRPSSLFFGHGPTGFSRENLYVVNFDGQVIEIEGARAPAPTPAPTTPQPPAQHPAAAATSATRKRCKAKKRAAKRKCRRKRRRG
jgi:sugar lactone lactonase YvrE